MAKLNWSRAKEPGPKFASGNRTFYGPYACPKPLPSWQKGWVLNAKGNYHKKLDGVWTTVFPDNREDGWRWVRGGVFSRLYRTPEGARIGAEESLPSTINRRRTSSRGEPLERRRQRKGSERSIAGRNQPGR